MFGVLRRNPRFRRLWGARVVSLLGDWLNRVAGLTLIGAIGGPEAAMGMGALFGIEIMVRFLPVAVLGPVAGPVADRVPRRMLMVIADLVRAATVLLLLLVREPGDLWLLYTVLMTQMGISIFFDSARSASVPNTLDDGTLAEAYAVSAVTWSTMLALGALVGGVLVEFIGVYGVFIVDALTYVVSALMLIGLKLPPVPKHPEPFRWGDIFRGTDLRRGLAHVRSLGLTPAVLAKAAWGGAGGFLVLIAIAAETRYDEAATGGFLTSGLAIGILYSARGLGTALGPIVGKRVLGNHEAGLRRQVSWGFVVGALGYVAFALIDSFWLACLCVVFSHMGGSALWVGSTVLWQRHVEDAYRGRVFALEFLAMTLSVSVLGLATGALYDATGSLRETTFALCTFVLLAGLGWTMAAKRILAAPAAAARREAAAQP